MSQDLPFRFQQALDPSGLTSFASGLRAIEVAVQECRSAHRDPARDPAIILLMRHLGRLAHDLPPDAMLSAACRARIAELEGRPGLIALAQRGVAFDASAKDRFHKDAHAALRELAAALGLAEGDFAIRHYPGDVAISGDVVLTGGDVEVAVSIGPLHRGCEVRYFARRGRAANARMRHVAIEQLTRPRRFASLLRRELLLADRTRKHAA